MGYFEKLRAGTAHKTYNPDVEGYGNERQWQSVFNVCMGFEEAQGVKDEAQRKGRKWSSDWDVVGDMAGVHIDENSMWSEIKSAFRKASMNCHPDRAQQHGKTVATATEEFKEVTAAYVMLEDVYRSKGRLN